MVLGRLRVLLDPGSDSSEQPNDMKLVLRTVRTLLRQFHVLLTVKCGAFLEVLLAGTSKSCDRLLLLLGEV